MTPNLFNLRRRLLLLVSLMIPLLVMATAAPAFRASGTAYAAPAAATAATTCTQCTTSVSGTVSAYVKATATANGYITIGGVKYVIKAGTTLSSLIKVGVYVSLRLTLNASGQITACTVLSVKVKVSGTVTAYVKATSTTNGSITIGGVKYVIKAGTTLSALIKVGVYANLTLTLNGSNQVTACTVISVKVNVSGSVTSYLPATSVTDGYITIGGVKYVIRAGTTLSSLIKVGVYANVTLTLNSLSKVTACAVISVKVKVSGLVTAYVKATATANGSVTIGGKVYVVKAGTTLPSAIKVGAYVNATLTLNGSGQVTSCTEISVTVSGLITVFVPATLLTTGQLVIDGQAFVIAKGASLPLSVGLNVTLTLTLNSAGEVTSCGCS